MAGERATWYSRYRPDWASTLRMASDRGATKRDAEGVWPTNRRAWNMTLLEASATHCWVWQEDMVPCVHFWEALRTTIDAGSEEVIVLLCARREMQKALETGQRWVELPDGTWGGTTIFPRELLREFLAWECKHVDPRLKSADARVDLWLRETGRVAYAAVPSLLQHVGDRSVMGHSGRRQTQVFLGDGPPFPFSCSPGPDTVVRSRRSLNHRMFDYLLEAS